MSKKMLGGAGFFLLSVILIQFLTMPDRPDEPEAIDSVAEEGSDGFMNSNPISYESLLMGSMGGSSSGRSAIMTGIYTSEASALSAKEKLSEKLSGLSLWRATDILGNKTVVMLVGPYDSRSKAQEALQDIKSIQPVMGQIVSYPGN